MYAYSVTYICILHYIIYLLLQFSLEKVYSLDIFQSPWPAFFKLFQIPRRLAHHSGSFFPADYDYLNYFFAARQDLPKFYVKSLKIT